MTNIKSILMITSFAGLFMACGKASETSDLASRSSSQSKAQFSCSYSVDGVNKSYTGPIRSECDKIRKELGLSVDAKLPAAIKVGAQAKVACAFVVNGSSFQGNTLAQCNALEIGVKNLAAATLPAGANGPSSYSCSFSSNGVTFKGSTLAECEALKQQYGIKQPAPSSPAPAGSNASISCSYSINGVTQSGSTQAECDKLKALSSSPAPSAPTLPAPSGPSAAVDCAFNVNGQVLKGSSAAECAKIKSDLGL